MCTFVCSSVHAILLPGLQLSRHTCDRWSISDRLSVLSESFTIGFFLLHPTRPMIDGLVPYDFLIDLWRDNLSDDIYVVLRYGVRFPPNINGYTDCRKINNWTVQIYSKAQNRGRHTIIHFRRLSDPLIDHKSNRSENRGFYDTFLWLIIISYRALRS